MQRRSERRSESENYKEYISGNVQAKLRRLNTVYMSEAKTQKDLVRETIFIHGVKDGFNENVSLREQVAKNTAGKSSDNKDIIFWDTYNDACMLLSSPPNTSLEQIKNGTLDKPFDNDILTALRQGLTQGSLLSAAEDQMVAIIRKAGYTPQAFTRDIHIYKEKNGSVRVVIHSKALEVTNTDNTETVLTGSKRGFSLKKTPAPIVELNLEFTLAPGCLTRGASNIHVTATVNNSTLEKQLKNAPAQLREDQAKAPIFRDQVVQDFQIAIKRLQELPNADKFKDIIDNLERKLDAINRKEYKTPLEVDQDISNMVSAARISLRELFPKPATPTTIVVPAAQGDLSTSHFSAVLDGARKNEQAKLKEIQEQPLSSLSVATPQLSAANDPQNINEIGIVEMLGTQQATTVLPLSDKQKATQFRDQIVENFSTAVRGYLSRKHEPTGIVKNLEHLVRDREKTQAKIELAEHLLAELHKLQQKDFSEPAKVMHAVLDLLVKYHLQNLHIEYGVKDADTSDFSDAQLKALNDARDAIEHHAFNYVTGNTFADMLNNLFESARENYQLTDKETPVAPTLIQEP